MAAEEKKKPKIDLRARLGKKTVGANNPSIPPPMGTGSIPAPAFTSKPPPAEEKPKIAEPQAIKIEMSEEVVQAQKKGRTKWIAIAVATAIVGAAIGTQIGGGLERSKRHGIAIEGAELLRKDIDESNVLINQLAEILGDAKRKLSDGEFPEEEMNKLSEVNIPFNGTYLAGKGTGLMSPTINKMLVDYAGLAGQANDQKDRLQRILTASSVAYKDFMEQQEKPKVQWTVYVVNGPHGPMAAVQPLPQEQQFLVTSDEKKDGKAYDWPEEIEIPEGDKKIKLELYEKDSPIGNPPKLIPVDPKSQSQVYPADRLLMSKLHTELVNLEVLLKGDTSDPTAEKAGLVDLGDSLINELKGIGG